jgi:hypothetical protein
MVRSLRLQSGGVHNIKKLVPAPPSTAFQPFGCGPVARCFPIAIKAAMVAT